MEKMLIRCEKASTYIAVLSIFVMMMLTTADAIGRYLFNYPIAGAYEVTEKYLMLIAVYLGASFTYREGSNIRIGLVIDRLPRQVRMGLNLFAQVFSICYGFVLVVPAVENVFRTYRENITLSSSNLPLWPSYLAIPIGLFLMALFMLRDLPRVRAGKSALFREEKTTDVMTESNSQEEGARP
jgi:TRAP-type C4-dicarboxylate transport system permease small subunit